MPFLIIVLIIITGALCFATVQWYKTLMELDEYKKTQGSLEDARKINKQILQENEVLIKKQNNLICELNELTDQQQKSKLALAESEIKNKTLLEQNDLLTAQMSSTQTAIDYAMRNQKELAQQAFSSYCDTLDVDYCEKEKEYDHLYTCLKMLYDEMHDSLASKHDMEKYVHEKEMKVIRAELDKIRATRAAALEAQLREQEIQDQATFYTLQLTEADKRDVAYLQSIEFNLREARPLRMLIWSTFYRDKVNELAARVGAIGASGIYKITHIDSGISYVGQAKDIKARFAEHCKCALGIDTPVTSKLYAFMREKGVDNFTFEILEKCNVKELDEKEKFYIDLYQTYDYGLNKTRGNG